MQPDQKTPRQSDRGEPPGTPAGSRRAAAVTVLTLLGLLVLTSVVMYWAWVEIGDVAISGHGKIALGLGIGLTVLVGVVLMGLVFFSSRRGFDERAHEVSEDRKRHRGP